MIWLRNKLINLKKLHGGCSSAGRAPGCGPGGRGFEPHHSPHQFFKMVLDNSGHGAIGSALALGARGCEFESRCPDHNILTFKNFRGIIPLYFMGEVTCFYYILY